jgi:hypothetical protein
VASNVPRHRQGTFCITQRHPLVGGTVLLAVMDPILRALALAALGAPGYTVLDAGPQPLLALRCAQEHSAPIDLGADPDDSGGVLASQSVHPRGAGRAGPAATRGGDYARRSGFEPWRTCV